jgi:hypothetical protein
MLKVAHCGQVPLRPPATLPWGDPPRGLAFQKGSQNLPPARAPVDSVGVVQVQYSSFVASAISKAFVYRATNWREAGKITLFCCIFSATYPRAVCISASSCSISMRAHVRHVRAANLGIMHNSHRMGRSPVVAHAETMALSGRRNRSDSQREADSTNEVGLLPNTEVQILIDTSGQLH